MYEGTFLHTLNLTRAWREKFLALDGNERITTERVIEQNKFSDEDISAVESANVRELLEFYRVRHG